MTRTKTKLDFTVTAEGCFVPTSHRLNKDGYCYVYHDRMEQRAHRFVYQECFGEIPNGLVVRHKCDNRGCINPEHLELGTQKDNVRDRVERKRGACGSKNGRSVINEDIARDIKILLRDGLYPTEIARRLGIGRGVVRSIKESNVWNHVAI